MPMPNFTVVPFTHPCRAAALLSALVLAVALPLAGAEPFVKNSEERARIEQALPRRAIVPPAQPRRLLIFTLNVGYGGHPSILYANEAFTLMGRKTGAFETEVSDDPRVFQRESLSRFDAVFFNNTVGNCFTNAELRQNLLEFITGGGGLLGVHGTSVAFTRWPGAVEDWPEFGCLLGGRGANHKDSDEHVWIKLDDPEHPLNRVFGGQGFDFRDEFFRVHGPYSRQRVRVLLSIDTTRTDVRQGPPRGDCLRADDDYALAWIRNYGRGRVFYCTIAHNPYVFWEPRMLEFYLAALQFALGDLPAPTTPSAHLTPAVQAQEKLGWRLGLGPSHAPTFFEAIDRAERLRLSYVGASSFQNVSAETPKTFGPQLSDEELQQVRLKLDASGVRLLTYILPNLPEEPAAQQRLFAFARKMGVETLICAAQPQALASAGRLCEQFDIRLALSPGNEGDCRPADLLRLCEGQSRYIGVCADLGQWLHFKVNPRRAARALKERLAVVHLHDRNTPGANGQDVPWGTGRARMREFLAELHAAGSRPILLGLDYPPSAPESLAVDSLEFFNQSSLNLAR